jgi:hypothetical protein
MIFIQSVLMTLGVETMADGGEVICRQGRLIRAGDRTRTGDVQLGKLAFYH